MEGLKAALARGRKGGRRRKLSAADEAVARAMLKDSTIPVAAIAKRLGISRATSTLTSRQPAPAPRDRTGSWHMMLSDLPRLSQFRYRHSYHTVKSRVILAPVSPSDHKGVSD